MSVAGPAAVDARGGARRYYRAGAIGAAIAGVIFVAVLMNGHLTLLERDRLGAFYDLQAHSFLQGRWDLPKGSLGIEGFVIDGKTYEYYGPVPALLRLPVAAITHRFDGRLTQLSMLLAFVVALTATVRLGWQTRRLVRGSDPVTPGECWLIGGLTFLVGAASAFVFLAGHAYVYHEAEIWGAALALAGFERIVAFMLDARYRTLVAAGAVAALAFLARASVGAGPVLALGLLFVASLTRWSRRAFGLPDVSATTKMRVALGIATAVPIALYAYVNSVKFGTFTTVPFDKQLFSQFNASRKAALAANGNSLFGLRFLPTTALQYLRPDAIRFGQLLPWVTFPGRATLVDDVRLDTRDFASSVPATMPVLTVLSGIGLFGIFRPASATRPRLAGLRAPAVGAVAGVLVTLTIAFVANRYLSDAMPLLVVAGLVGLHLLARWATRRSWQSATVKLGAVVLAILGIYSLWANVGLAVLYQRMLSTSTDAARRAAFVDAQYQLHDIVPGGRAPYVERGEHLPGHAPMGRVFVVDPCKAIYWSTGNGWRVLARTQAGGEYQLRASFPEAAPPGSIEPLIVTRGPGGATQSVVVRYGQGRRIALGFLGAGIRLFTRERRVLPGREHTIHVVLDPRTGEANATLDGRRVLELDTLVSLSGRGRAFLFEPDQVSIGTNPHGGEVGPRFTGRLRSPTSARPELCRRLGGTG